ncbi:MAG: sulfatase-like hydrolase/transferase, partial [Bacteroidales bacterium]|nr:sulfatase-like hydrolase/transferase [Bacteroidales bacterium]
MRSAKIMNEYLVLIYRMAVMMLLYSLTRLGFYFFNSSFFPNVSFSGLLTIMKGGLMFDISALLYINVLYLLLYLLPLPFKFKGWYQMSLKVLFLVTNAVGLAVNVADIIYYRFTLKRTTSSVFDIFANEENMGNLWLQFLVDYWYALVFWLLLTGLMVFLYGRLKPKPIPFSSKWFYGLSGLVFMVLFSGFSIVGMRGGYRHSTRPINMSNAGKFVKSPEEMALVLNTSFSMLRTIGKKSFVPLSYFPEEQLAKVFTPEHFPDVEDTTSFKDYNVVVIILESFNREHSGYLNPQLDGGEYKGYTPFLDSLMRESLTFAQGFANGRKSIDAMPSVLASLPALVQPYVVSEYSSNRINGLGSMLRDHDYHTSFFHGAPNGSMGFDAIARLSGFDHYYGRTEYGNDADFDGIWGIWDEPFFQFFAEKLNGFPEPFATALFSVSSHHPFKVPAKYEGVFDKGTLPLHQCVGYTDKALRDFFEAARKAPWYDRTVFVITADHSVPSHFETYKTNINGFAVPIVFHAPGLALKGLDHSLAQQIDILPTLMGLLNYPEPYVAFGNDLLDLEREDDRFVLNYVSETFQFLMNEWAIYYDGKKVVALYNRLEDPLLRNNLIQNRAVPEKEFEFFKAIIQQYNN